MPESNKPADYVVPVVSEEFHADAVPVETGSVRVVKRVEGHEEVLEQELRKGKAEIRRIKTDRIVDGPQSTRQDGNTLIIPVVSEVLVVQKQWVVTEEIHITRIEEKERVEQQVTVNREVADIERLDESGRVIASGDRVARQEVTPAGREIAARRGLSNPESLLKHKAKH